MVHGWLLGPELGHGYNKYACAPIIDLYYGEPFDGCPNPCAHAHKLSCIEHAQNLIKNANICTNVQLGEYEVLKRWLFNVIIIILRKMASNKAFPGPSTSGFSSPSESPWEVQQVKR